MPCLTFASKATRRAALAMVLSLAPGGATLLASPPTAPDGGPWTTLSPRAAATAAALSRSALLYFQENANQTTGLVRATAPNFAGAPVATAQQSASLAATGLGLAVMANASDRGLVSYHEAYEYALRTLQFVAAHRASLGPDGFLYASVDWQTGARADQSPVSTEATATFYAGALYAARVFDGTPVAGLAAALFAAVDFDGWRTDDGANFAKLTLPAGFLPESGFTAAEWDHYEGHTVGLVLALGSPHAMPPAAWTAWKRQTLTLADGQVILGGELPLADHLAAGAFLDLTSLSEGGVSYTENSRRAVLANRTGGLGASGHRTNALGFWGQSDCAPAAAGATACLATAVAGALYLPELVLDDAANWRDGYGAKIWGRYGLANGIAFDDPNNEWVAPDADAVTLGTLFLNLANIGGPGPASTWWRTNSIAAVRKGLVMAQSVPPAALQ